MLDLVEVGGPGSQSDRLTANRKGGRKRELGRGWSRHELDLTGRHDQIHIDVVVGEERRLECERSQSPYLLVQRHAVKADEFTHGTGDAPALQLRIELHHLFARRSPEFANWMLTCTVPSASTSALSTVSDRYSKVV